MPSSSGCCLPAFLPPVGEGPVHSWLALLWYLPSPLFCEQVWQCLKLELFTGKFSLTLFFFLSLAIPQFGFLSHVSSLRLSQGIQAQSLSTQLAPPCSAPACCWRRRASGLLLHWELQLGMLSVGFLFFLPVMLPSEIPNLPTGPPMRGFPGVWKLLILHYSLHRTGLCP